jgi:hypothetical protein
MHFQWRAMQPGRVRWDFGDGTKPVVAHTRPPKTEAVAYPNTLTHRYAKPGHYLARLEWAEDGRVSVYHLHVVVGE